MNENRLYSNGDSLVVKVTPKANGTLKLNSFTDELTGVTETRTITREFRIIEDDLFSTDWYKLTIENLSSRIIVQNSVIEVRYTRGGTDSTDYIEFVNIKLDGDYTVNIVNSPTLDASIFSSIAWTSETENIAKNLFKKLYFRGIIPDYIQRGDNLSKSEDGDYIVLFSTIAKFYAIIIRFFKRFENFYDDFDLMREWVRQTGIYFDESKITLSELQYISQNMYDEIRKRGTTLIFSRKGDTTTDGDTVKIDGEFIRLIRSKADSELLYENMPIQSVGWCLQRSSPMYRGTTTDDVSLNKTKEKTQDFQSVDNFVNFNTSHSTISISSVSDKKCLLLKTTGSAHVGLGRDDNSTIDISDNMYVADADMDYEISFWVYVNLAGKNAKLNFGVEGFDSLKNKLSDSFITPNGDSIVEKFLDGMDLTKFIENKWYHIRGIIHAYGSENKTDIKTNIGYGTNLYFNNKFVRYIFPKIFLSSSNSSSIYLWDYKIRPLVRGTNILKLKDGTENSHSLGFLQSPKIFYAYFRNNNNSQSSSEITDIIDKYLLPFNTTDILTFIGNE
jgi:hypothetical protein